MSTWTKQLSVGNRILDSEHKKLHGIINQIACTIAARNVAALPEEFNQLENCLCAYFPVEEYVAQTINFDFTQHKLAHQHLLNEVQRIRNELTASNCACPDNENYARCLMNCLIQHIDEDSKLLKIVLDTCLYDFNPHKGFVNLDASMQPKNR